MATKAKPKGLTPQQQEKIERIGMRELGKQRLVTGVKRYPTYQPEAKIRRGLS